MKFDKISICYHGYSNWPYNEMNELGDSYTLCEWKGFTNRQIVRFLEMWACQTLGSPGEDIVYSREWTKLMSGFELNFSERNSFNLAYYQDATKKDRGIRTPIKPGKLFRKLFPDLPDTAYAELVDCLKDTFDISQFSYGKDNTPEGFARIYEMRITEFTNPATNFYRKSLANSCMGGHKEFSHLEFHPCEAYGSGDFEIHFLIASDGLLAARSIVNVAKCGNPVNPTNGPIYGVSELSIDQLQFELNAIGVSRADTGDWVGARLIANPQRDGLWCAPYLDICPQSLFAENGKEEDEWLIIKSGGNVTGSNHQGTQEWNGSYCACEQCGDSIYGEDDAYYSESRNQTMCESCYDSYHAYCESCDERFDLDDMETVFVANRYGYNSQCWCEYCRDNNAVECSDDRYWRLDDAIYCEFEDAYISPNDIDEYFMSENDGEYYPNDQRAELESGDIWSIGEAEDYGYVQCWISGKWYEPSDSDLTPDQIKSLQLDSHVQLRNAVDTFQLYLRQLGHVAGCGYNPRRDYAHLGETVIRFFELNDSQFNCVWETSEILANDRNCPIDGNTCDGFRENERCRYSPIERNVAIAAE